MDFPARHLWSPDGNIPINQPWLGVVLTHLCQQGGMRYNPMSMNLYLYWEWFLALGLQHYVLFKNRGADSREIKHCWLDLGGHGKIIQLSLGGFSMGFSSACWITGGYSEVRKVHTKRWKSPSAFLGITEDAKASEELRLDFTRTARFILFL